MLDDLVLRWTLSELTQFTIPGPRVLKPVARMKYLADLSREVTLLAKVLCGIITQSPRWDRVGSLSV